MSRLQILRAHADWANRELLRVIEREPAAPASCRRWLAHVIAAEEVWLARIEGRRPELPVWPELAPEACARWLERLHEGWARYLERLTPEELERSCSYVNSAGQAWSSRVEDVLDHVILHGAHHRGQIASALAGAGLKPPSTDLIHAVRSGLLDGGPGPRDLSAGPGRG